MKYATFFFFIIVVSSCVRSHIFEKNEAVKSFQWNNSDKKMFTFDINDTISTYSIYFNLRHTDAYKYANIWIQIGTKYPNTDTFAYAKKEIVLANADGKWLGRGMNEIWEHSMLIASNVKFSKLGTYTITTAQIMRDNPLPQIMGVGLRVQKE